ncbi:MAG: hypothetical protein V2J42_05215 [Wenzhouxiangella sp.]|jgi:hypothetical protein|nr:hypothetical protein [Wenzhouxiangella sp.]
MNRILLLTLAVGLLPLGAGAQIEQIELFQRYEVMAQQQRVVGNLRAVAKTDGIVVRVPQLYVYHAELSAAFHLGGFRPGFERELEMMIEARRGERSMIRLDRLLERTRTPDGNSIAIEDLPPADVTLALYRRPDCPECDQVAETLRSWIAGHPDRSVLWLDVRTDTPRN